MSLDSLYVNLNYYSSQTSYWATSAAQYGQQIAGIDSDLADRRRQLQLAQQVQSKCGELSGLNDQVTQRLQQLGQDIDSALRESSATNACKNLNAANGGHIASAVSQAGSLVARLQSEIDSLNARRATAVEGQNYSSRRSAMFSRYASSTRDAIANYHED